MVLEIGDNVLINDSVWSVGSFSNGLEGEELVDMINIFTQEYKQFPLEYVNTFETYKDSNDTSYYNYYDYDEPPDNDNPDWNDLQREFDEAVDADTIDHDAQRKQWEKDSKAMVRSPPVSSNERQSNALVLIGVVLLILLLEKPN